MRESFPNLCVCHGCNSACVAQEDRARAEALLYFKGKHSNDTSANGGINDGDVLDPVLQELTTSIDTQLHALQKQSSQLNDCLKVGCVEVYRTNATMCIFPISASVPFIIRTTNK